MQTINLNVQSKRSEVDSFLKDLKNLLNKEDFNIDSNFVLIRKHKKNDEVHSTPYTLLDLGYDTWDIIERLKELTAAEYSETKIDKDNLDPPLLFVFGKDIEEKLVYIKLKLQGEQTRRVLCVSFHYAKEPMNFPFA